MSPPRTRYSRTSRPTRASGSGSDASSTGQPRKDLVVHEPVRREHAPLVSERTALEGGAPSARFFEDDLGCGEIPGRQLWLQHHLGGAPRDQHVRPEVPEPAGTPA